jgi:aromatic ring-opening dioxygenase catalytic subunit (LigB family)
MSIVFACATSHAPGVTAWSDAVPPEQLAKVTGSFDKLRRSLRASEPDRLLLLTSEHWANFFLDHIGAFCVGRAETFEGPVEPWLKIERRKIPGDPQLATRLLEHCYAHGFELSHAHEMNFDHGTMVPLNFLQPDMGIPVVPIMFNTLAPPRARPERCIELGEILRPLLEQAPERIAVIATGGLSHDPGEPNHGYIDSEFDRRFLQNMADGNLPALGTYTDGQLMAAGAGTVELLAWLCLAGIMGGGRPQIALYEAIPQWATGIGMLSYEIAGNTPQSPRTAVA